MNNMHCTLSLVLLLLPLLPATTSAQGRMPVPIRQATIDAATAGRVPVTLRDASRNDRWLGLGPRDVRWAPDGSVVYFRWNRRPTSNDVPELDPWFRADRDGRWVEEVPAGERELVPGDGVQWDSRGRRAAWIAGNAIYLYTPASTGGAPVTRRIVALERVPSRLRFAERDSALHFMAGEVLYRVEVNSGTLSAIAARVTPEGGESTPAAMWLMDQQRELSARVRDRARSRDEQARATRLESRRPQEIPVPAGARLEEIQLSPDGKHLTFRVRTVATRRPPTRYMDFTDASGYARVLEARAKVGEPRDVVRFGALTINREVAPESLTVRWFTVAEAKGEGTIPHGPWWSPDGRRAVVQFAGERAKDLWIAEVDLASGGVHVLAHEHDDGWLGGPPIQSNYTGPALLEWLAEGSIAIATERSGWSHLARIRSTGAGRAGGGAASAPMEPMTTGAWEVRGAELSRDRSQWLLQGSRDAAAEDHLYLMNAIGGELTRLTTTGGRNAGVLSPDGSRVAIVRSDATSLPDLFVRPVRMSSPEQERRITASGTDEMLRRRLVKPEIVSFAHPDGQPVYAALYRPEKIHPTRAALIHVHGGGYRQFAHLGWSVYGWSGHLGLLHHFLEQGYVVLDFDYRGGAGFGKAYRTDVAGVMGGKDVDGAVAAARYLVREVGVDSARIGMYGVSYGGFMTLMSQFRYPGVFAAGISRAPVTDWAHYSDSWTSRILGVPHVDSASYRRSSPIYYAEGLQDHLLIEHGLVDDNVHFQDTARLVQRLLELEKEFEVMYYPTEPHVVETEAGRYDQSRRAAGFFARYLLGEGG